MNCVIISGRLTREPELKGSEKTCAQFSVAVQRSYKNSEGKYDADFFNCVAFGKTGDFVMKYFTKGQWITVRGELRTGSYINKEGNKVNTTDIIADKVEFCGSKADNEKTNTGNSTPGGFSPIDDDLPFN